MALTLDRKAFIDILSEGQGDIGGADAAAARRPMGHAAGDAAELCRAMTPMCRRTARKPARSWRSSATGPTTGSRSRCRRAISRLSRSGGDPDRPAEGDLHRRRARHGRDRQWYPEGDAQGLQGRRSTSPRAASTIPTSNSTRTTRAGRSAITPATAIRELDKLIDQQSTRSRPGKRKQLVWEIERKLAEDGARPIIFHTRAADLLAAPGQGPDDDGQQHLQRLALGRRLAR